MVIETRKAFTLIEMLIVVVIIGILAAALIPRLQSVQGRARDTKRKADISQIGSSLAIFKSDIGSFSPLTAAIKHSDLTPILVTNGNYITAMPAESDQSTWLVSGAVTVTGYAFAPMLRNGIANNAFVLMARTETDGASSNWVRSTATPPTTSTGGAIGSGANVSILEGQICTRVTATALLTNTVLSGGVCNALKSANDLRYIYTQ